MNTGNHSVTVTTGACEISDTIAIQILPAPPIQLGVDTFICDNSTMLLDVYEDLATQYTWQDGSSLSTFEVTEAGQYFVAVDYLSGCTNFDTINISSEIVINLDLPTDTSFCIGTPILLNAHHEAAKSYFWTG